MNLREFYKDVNGDYDYMMARLPREASVIKFLRKFSDNTEFNELKEAWENKNYTRIFELSHDLKGIAANLSMPVFQNLMSEICEETRNGNPDEKLSGYILTADEEYKHIIKAIGEIEEA